MTVMHMVSAPNSTILLIPFAVALLLCFPGCSRIHPSQKEVLTIWSAPTGLEEQSFKKLCARFEREHPQITIKHMGGLTQEKLESAIVAGCPPDLAYIYNIVGIAPMAANGALVSLDSYFQRSGLHEKDFLPGAIAQMRFRGNLYAMPTTRDSRALYYNRTRFKEAGLDPAHPPQTLEELVEYAKRMTHTGSDGNLTSLGMFLPADAAVLFAIFGGGIWDDHRQALTINRTENVEALKWLVDLADAQGGFRAVSAFAAGFGSDTSSQNPLATGKVGMKIDGEYEAMHIEKFAPETDYALAELPHPQSRPDLKNIAWMDGDFIAIPSGSKHPYLGWEFIRWMQMPSQQSEYAVSMSNLPTILSIRHAPEFSGGSKSKRALGFVLNHIASESPNPRFLPTLPVIQVFENALRNTIDKALYHDLTPAEALNQLQAKMEKELQLY